MLAAPPHRWTSALPRVLRHSKDSQAPLKLQLSSAVQSLSPAATPTPSLVARRCLQLTAFAVVALLYVIFLLDWNSAHTPPHVTQHTSHSVDSDSTTVTAAVVEALADQRPSASQRIAVPSAAAVSAVSSARSGPSSAHPADDEMPDADVVCAAASSAACVFPSSNDEPTVAPRGGALDLPEAGLYSFQAAAHMTDEGPGVVVRVTLLVLQWPRCRFLLLLCCLLFSLMC
jgi:hypothetical protein